MLFPETISKWASSYSKTSSTPCQRQCRSNTVECYKVECCFDFVAVCRRNVRLCCRFGNNVERVFREILSFLHSRNKLNIERTKFRSALLPKSGKKRQPSRSNVRLCRTNRSTWAFDNVASTLLLVWTGLKRVWCWWISTGDERRRARAARRLNRSEVMWRWGFLKQVEKACIRCVQWFWASGESARRQWWERTYKWALTRGRARESSICWRQVS